MRFIEICLVLLKYTVLHKLTRYRAKNFGFRLKLAFERLGITFIKIGQILSMRYDLLSAEDRKPLRALLDDVKPIAFTEILNILQKEYARPFQQIFLKIEEQPIGSASVSQVHRGLLLDGSVVAIKIKRPEVDRTFIRDVRFLKTIAAIGEFLIPKLRYVRAKQLTAYFESWIKQDLNFELEVQNMRKIAGQLSFATSDFRSDLGRMVFPEPFENLCTPNVIVMDYLDGIAINHKNQINSDPKYDLSKSVRSFIVAVIRSWLQSDDEIFYFQADPHFSNILALPGGDVASIDQGLVSSLPKHQAQCLKNLVIAVYLQDLQKVVAIAKEITEAGSNPQSADLERDLNEFLEKAKQQTFGFWFSEFIKVLVRHRRKIPLFISSFGRAAIIVDSLAYEYLPGETTLDILDYEFKRAILLGTFKQLLDVDLKKIARVLTSKITKIPNLIDRAVEDPFRFLVDMVRAVKEAVA